MLHASEVLFRGRIPTQISIAESDVTSVKVPVPYYAMLSRMSYLPLETTEAVNHFRGSVIELDQAIWFECNGHPLKSNLPVGVLFDMFSQSNELPWKIVIHFRQFPGNKLLKCSNRNDASRVFSHAVKQAVYLLSGNTRLFTSLSIQKQDDLMSSLTTGDISQYREIVGEIVTGMNVSSIRSLPIAVVANDGRPVIQRPICAFNNRNSSIRERVNEQCQAEDVEENNDSTSTHFTSVQDVLSECFQDTSIIERVVIQGVTVPLGASIYDVWERFWYPDLFLYIVVHLKLNSL